MPDVRVRLAAEADVTLIYLGALWPKPKSPLG
jgi:hypothetical protein